METKKVNGKKVLAGVGILLMLGISAGCSEAEKFSWERLKETHYRMVTGKHLNTAESAALKEGQAAAAAAVDATLAEVAQEQEPADKAKQEIKKGKVDVVLYFADQNGDYLKAEKRQIEMVPGLAKAAVDELIKGPVQKGLSKTIPQGTKVREINIENGLCRIDLSKEFKENHWGGSSGEILTVYSLVDTLTQFDTVKKVEILVEGQKVDTLAGHMDLTSPVFRNTQIVKSAK